MMQSGVNRPRDVSQSDGTKIKLEISCRYANEEDAIKNLFLLATNYNNNKTFYTLMPRNIFGFPTGWNSNSFISGLGSAAGFNMPAPSATGKNTIGYQNVLPEIFFRP